MSATSSDIEEALEADTFAAFNETSEEEWSAQASAEMYGVREWGAGYFDINDSGDAEVVVSFGEKKIKVALIDIVKGMQDRGLEMPVVLRIENLLDHRISLLNDAFANAIEKANYQNYYRQ